MPDETGIETATRRRRGRSASLIAVALTLVLAGTALAAHPKAGRHYRGVIPRLKINGFTAPVSFTVSADGRKLMRFKYGSLGCQGAGGFRPGVSPFTGDFLVPVGAITVATSGRFSVRNSAHSVSTTKGVPLTTKTTTSVTGRFTSSKRATGAITFSQSFHPRHGMPFGCGPVTLAFAAAVH